MEGHGFEVAPGLHRIEAPLGERYVACYLVLGQDAAMLVDTGIVGTFDRSIMPYAASIGVAAERIRWAVVTHADVDHMGGDATLRALVPDATLVAHEADRALIEDVDRIVEDRYREFTTAHDIDIDPGMIAWCHEVAGAAPIGLSITAAVAIDLGGRRLEVIPTPGHSPGSISVWDASTGSAMTSDAVLGSSLHLADGRPAFPPTYRLPGPYRATIADLDARAPTWLLTAHEPVMGASAARAFLAESRDFCDRLEAAALQELRAAGPLTTRELIDRLAPRVGQWEPSAWDLLAYGLVGHLEELEASGAIVALEGWPVGWAPAPTGGT
jgi:glyoxylase-like metal-dependent hydrolase (beta-lactamase superfamily II)